MKNLLRKIFFWDEPAKGAFFAVTLLYVLPKCLYAIGVDFLLPYFLRGKTQQTVVLYLMVVLVAVPLLYALVTFVHFLPKVSKHKKAYLLGLCCCAVLVIGFRIVTALCDDNELYSHFWWMIPILYVVWFIIYAFWPAVQVWEWIAAGVTLTVGIISYVYFINDAMRSFAILYIYGGDTSQIGKSAGLMWLLFVCSILFLTTSYLLFGRIVAKGGGVPFKRLFGRSVATLWIIFVVICLTSICMALYAMHDYRKAQKELADYWGFTVNNKTLVELYNKNGKIDQSFWEDFNGLNIDFPEIFKKYDGIDSISSSPDAILPSEIYVEWKTAFNESKEVRRGEEMLDTPLNAPPPPSPDRIIDYRYDEFHSNLISQFRIMTCWELWRVRLALEDKDIATAKKALQRIDNLCMPLMLDYSLGSGLVWWAIEPMRTRALSQILSSGLADEEWLREQNTILQEKERLIPEVEKRMLLGHAACMMDMMDTLFEYTSHSSFLLVPEAWFLLGREGAILARCHCISGFADFPEKSAGIFTEKLVFGLQNIGTKHVPKMKATLRVARGLIEAELARQKTGSYPAVMDNLPEDPFTGKTLRYAVGDCEIPEEHFQLNDEYEADKQSYNTDELPITPEAMKQLGMDEQQIKDIYRPRKYTFNTERRTVKAVQIWSVGSNCIDDGGVRKPAEYGSKEKDKDDIRFIIQIQ